MIALTGATGQLGRLVITQLLKTTPAASIVAIVRDATKAADLAALGVVVRVANYTDAAALEQALAGVDRLLLISSSEVGQRAVQHANVVTAAQRQGVATLLYTSVLHATTSTLGLAEEHRQTEAMIKASGLAYVFLRNGWYTENYTAGVPAALGLGAVYGSAGEGRIASATRQDYAEAAARALVGPVPANSIYELAGDDAYTLADLAAEISRQTGKTIPYRDLPEADYRAALVGAGLPEGLAAMLASSDVSAAGGALFDDGRQLKALIGRPTTPLATAVAAALPKA